MIDTGEKCDICGDSLYTGCVVEDVVYEPGCCSRCTKAVRFAREQKALQDSICKECGFIHPGGTCMDS